MARHFDVAVMHDFFVDRLVHIDSSRIARLVLAKSGEGGGGVHGIAQDEIRGGNAVNLAHALARLGLKTLLVTHSDSANEQLLLGTFEGLPAELRVKPLKAGMTVAFEGRVNVMLGDGGGAADFGPQLLDDEDWRAVGRAGVVCCVNWAANARGTELLLSIKKMLGQEKTVFFDPADFRDRIPEFRGLLRIIKGGHVADWVSMNEEESMAAAETIGLKAHGIAETCRLLAKELHVSFDLHSVRASYRSDGRHVVGVAVRKAKPKRLTGAGDIWDAGSIYGRLLGWDDRRTVLFANQAAKIYLESPTALPPTAGQVVGSIG